LTKPAPPAEASNPCLKSKCFRTWMVHSPGNADGAGRRSGPME
jgi:hypothetical protein